MAAGLKPPPEASKYPEGGRRSQVKTRRNLALRIGACVWIVAVLSTLGIIYLARKVIHGPGVELSIFDGFDITAYIGLAVVLAPSMVVILVSTWLDRAKEVTVIEADRSCHICNGSGEARLSSGEPSRECAACAGTGERVWGAGRVVSPDRKRAPDK